MSVHLAAPSKLLDIPNTSGLHPCLARFCGHFTLVQPLLSGQKLLIFVDALFAKTGVTTCNHYYLKRSPAEESHQPGPAEIQHQLSGRHVYRHKSVILLRKKVQRIEPLLT